MIEAQTGKTIETYLATVLAGKAVDWPNVDTHDPGTDLVYEPHVIGGKSKLLNSGRPAKVRLVGRLVVKLFVKRNTGREKIDEATDLLSANFSLRIIPMDLGVIPPLSPAGIQTGTINKLDTITEGDVKFQTPEVVPVGLVAQSRFQENWTCVYWSEATIATKA